MSVSRPAAVPFPAPNEQWALFLDVDGTLVEITDTPHGTRVAPETLALLKRLARLLDGALALVSGRSVRDVDRLFAPHHFATAGVHGFEYRNQNDLIRLDESSTQLDRARQAIQDFAHTAPGVIVEDKGMALTVHYRMAPSAEPALRKLMSALGATLGERFHVQDGKMLLELKPTNRDKGHAISSFMEEEPFIHRVPVYVGDDVTDEDGFATVNRLGGLSIRVGAEANSHARYSLPSVHDVLAWLGSVANALSPDRT
jgi:trehalose 6-phosphate phosphatase